MEENFSMEWKIFLYVMEIEWKEITNVEYEKIIFRSIPYHAQTVGLFRA